MKVNKSTNKKKKLYWKNDVNVEKKKKKKETSQRWHSSNSIQLYSNFYTSPILFILYILYIYTTTI